MSYRFTTHDHVPDLICQLTELTRVAFAEYEGAAPANEAFTAWYLRRPGSEPELCTAALCGDGLVSNVLVAIQHLQIGGETLPCGIIDTVATSPDHRRRGLARRLMQDAHIIMREHGAEAAVLYTNPDGHPYGFYHSLGYATRAFAAGLHGPRPDPVEDPSTGPAASADGLAVRALLDAFHASHEGYAPLTDALWHWHRTCRPADMPLNLVIARDAAGSPLATAAFASADLLIAGTRAPTTIISDFAAARDTEVCLDALLSAAPDQRIMAFVDLDDPVHRMLLGRDFVPVVREAALVLPFSDRAMKVLQSHCGPWYVMVESVVGV